MIATEPKLHKLNCNDLMISRVSNKSEVKRLTTCAVYPFSFTGLYCVSQLNPYTKTVSSSFRYSTNHFSRNSRGQWTSTPATDSKARCFSESASMTPGERHPEPLRTSFQCIACDSQKGLGREKTKTML